MDLRAWLVILALVVTAIGALTAVAYLLCALLLLLKPTPSAGTP